MPSHSRQDPRLPTIQPVDPARKDETLAQAVERAKAKLGIMSKWQRYGKNAESGTEAAQPGEEKCHPIA